jgi:hypothetical protein
LASLLVAETNAVRAERSTKVSGYYQNQPTVLTLRHGGCRHPKESFSWTARYAGREAKFPIRREGDGERRIRKVHVLAHVNTRTDALQCSIIIMWAGSTTPTVRLQLEIIILTQVVFSLLRHEFSEMITASQAAQGDDARMSTISPIKDSPK